MLNEDDGWSSGCSESLYKARNYVGSPDMRIFRFVPKNRHLIVLKWDINGCWNGLVRKAVHGVFCIWCAPWIAELGYCEKLSMEWRYVRKHVHDWSPPSIILLLRILVVFIRLVYCSLAVTFLMLSNKFLAHEQLCSIHKFKKYFYSTGWQIIVSRLFSVRVVGEGIRHLGNNEPNLVSHWHHCSRDEFWIV